MFKFSLQVGYCLLNVLCNRVTGLLPGSHDVGQSGSQVIIIFLEIKHNIKGFYAFVSAHVVVRSF